MATIKENSVNGKIISFKFTSCLGRDAQGKQIRRYTTWKPPEGMTPSKARKAAEREAAAWEADLRAEFEANTTSVVQAQEKTKVIASINFVDYVKEAWLPICIENGEYKPKTVSYYTDMSKNAVKYFGEQDIREIDFIAIQKFLIYMRKDKGYSPRYVHHHYRALCSIFAFALKQSGVLKAADKDLNPLEDVYFPVLKIIREEEKHKPLEYHTGDKIRVYDKDTLIGEFSKESFESVVSILFNKIPEGKSAFEIEETEAFFEEIQVKKVKADSAHKQDIEIQIHDINTGISPVCGFSIKSYLGARPTLINAGRNTNFVFTIENCNDELMERVNEISSGQKIRDRMAMLLASGCQFVPESQMISPQFEENLEFVDSLMPRLLSYAVLRAYIMGSEKKTKRVKEVIAELKEDNPLNYTNTKMYEYKFKKLLCACALGMTPERHWEGSEDANGGYIVVKKDGSVVCYHLYNRMDFEQYLLDYTCFDSPSTSRYEYMQVYKDGENFKIKLNLQIRFI